MNESGESKKRKRIKLICNDCGSQFDDDYRRRHELLKHCGKRISVMHVGAPKNPFEAAMKLMRNPDGACCSSSSKSSINAHEIKPAGMQEVENLNDTEANPDVGVSVIKQLPREIVHESYYAESTSGASNASLLPNVEPHLEKQVGLIHIENITTDDGVSLREETMDITDQSTELEKNDDSWLTTAGYLSAIVDDLEYTKSILNKIQTDDVPNPIKFLSESIQAIKSIQSKSVKFLKMAPKVLENIMNTEMVDQSSEPPEGTLCTFKNYNLVKHDPGQRENTENSMSDNQRLYLIALGPYQPILPQYPVNSLIASNKQRTFSARWFKEYPHLEYSISCDAVFCFVCCLFPSGLQRNFADVTWTQQGLRQWHKMKSMGAKNPGKLALHFSSKAHKAALQDYCNFIETRSHIDVLLNKTNRKKLIQVEQQKAHNSEIITILIDVARTLARQNLAFQGNKDEGNFEQIVHLISRHCFSMKRWIDDTHLRPHHVTYLSYKCQNEFIELLASKVKEQIVQEIKNVNFYTVMADTTPDVTHKDILSVCIRVVDYNGNPKERLLETTEIKDKTGLGMAQKITEVLVNNGLDPKNIAFQSYDYASSMSGIYQGAQKKLSEIVGHDIPYIPCQAHRLNTFVEHSCEASPLISNLFSDLESLYVFFSSSTKRYSYLSTNLKNVENVLKLTNLSKTRWTSRADSIRSVWNSFENILEVLEEISVSQKFDAKTRQQSLALYKKVKTFDFIVCIMFMKNVMYKLKLLTKSLEAEDLNIIDASNLMQSTIRSLDNINSDIDSMNNLIDSAIAFCKNLSIDAQSDFNKHHRKRLVPKRYDENRNTQVHFQLHLFYRTEFKATLDTLLTLSKENLSVCIERVAPLFAIFNPPLKRSNCNLQNVKKACQMLPNVNVDVDGTLNVEAMQSELEVLIDHCTELSNLDDVMEKAKSLKRILPFAYKLCCLLFTAPVTTASNERSFSRLKLVKSCLRSTMDDGRLNSLLILTCEKDITDKIDLLSVVEKWAILKERRIYVK